MVVELTETDWLELELAPIWVLGAVGGADGKVDQKERAALLEGVGRCAKHADPFVREVFHRVSKNYDAIWARYMSDERFAVHALRTVETVLDRTTDAIQALHFKQTLVQLGVEIADASGGLLGLRQRSDVERKALNDVAKALRISSRRLIAASQSNFDSIVVALDGSPEAEAALSVARTIAERFGSPVTLLQVVVEPRPTTAVAPEGYVGPVGSPPAAELRSIATAYLESVRSTYGLADWQAEVAQGDPAAVIVNFARDAGANLIVLATSGSAGVKRIFEAKVTEEVGRLAEIPVLLVPVGDEQF